MSEREATIQLHCSGKTKSEIIKLLKVAKSTVYYIVKRFKDIGTSKDRSRKGKPRTDRSQKMIKAVQ